MCVNGTAYFMSSADTHTHTHTHTFTYVFKARIYTVHSLAFTYEGTEAH